MDRVVIKILDKVLRELELTSPYVAMYRKEDAVTQQMEGAHKAFSIIRDFIYDLDKEERIELTEDILRKNGFKGVNMGCFPEDTSYCVELAITEDGKIEWCVNGEYTIGTFKYVDELQTALDLFGIKKEIVI